MAETIKGINVVIGAETTALSAALQDVNRRSRDIRGELRQVDRLLRLDPTNVDLVSQRQQLLTNAVANTRERLDALRAAQEQVNQQFQRGEISEGQYRAFQREIIQAEQELKRFEDRLTNINRPADQLANTLDDISQRSRGLQNELRQVDRLLQLDPSNVELVAQRQEILNRAILTSQERLNALRGAQERVNEQFRRGEISEAQYRAFQRDVAAAEQELRRLESRLRGADQEVRDLGESMQRTGEQMQGMGEKMSVGLTAPIVATGAVLTKGAADAQASMGKLQAALGLTREEAADLSAVSEAVWVNGFGENIEEATQAVINIRHNIGKLAEDEMQEVTEAAMTIAQAFDQDVNEVTRAAGVAMKNWGVSAKEAMDLLSVGFQRGGNYSDELLDTIREYSPQFASMGIGAEQAMSMLIAGAQAGAWNLDKVGDAAKEFNLRAQDGSKGTAEGFALIGLNAEKTGAAIAAGGEEAQQAFMATVTALAAMDDPLEQNTAGVALFGTQWEDVRSQVIIAMGEGMKGLGDFRGATAEATKALQENNPGLALTKSMRELQLSIGPALLPIAEMISNQLAPALASMAQSFASLSPAMQTFSIAAAGVLAILGPILAMIGAAMPILVKIGGLIAGLGPIITSVATFIGGAAAAIATALSLPVAAVAAIVAAVVAAGVLIVTHWDEIKAAAGQLADTIAQAWESLKAATIAAWEAIKTFVVEAFQWLYDHNYYFQDLVDAIVNAWNTAKEVTTVVWSAVRDWLTNLWSNIKNTVVTTWNSILTTITGVLDRVKGAFQGLVDSAFNWGKNLMGEFIDGFKSMFSNLYDSLERAAEAVAGFLGFHSPTKLGPGRDADKWAPNFVNMFAQGIEDSLPRLQDALNEMSVTLNPSLAGGGTTNQYGGNTIHVTVQDSEDLLRTLRRMGVSI